MSVDLCDAVGLSADWLRAGAAAFRWSMGMCDGSVFGTKEAAVMAWSVREASGVRRSGS
jgi:hypothetical protein